MRLDVVLVHYRTPELAVAAVGALRADAAATGLDLDLAIVDNGNDPSGRERLRALQTRVLEPGDNLGYAGGANLGVASGRSAIVVVANPDVFVLPGCLGALVTALGSGAAAAGPQFLWDSAGRLLLPPAELRRRRDETATVLARHRPRWATEARRRWRTHARRHWRATEPLATYSLSGALLAFRRSAWNDVGPFDDGFRLYFEETDWLARLARRHLPAKFVPAARAVHLHDQSAGGEPRAGGWFTESADRFRRRHLGSWFPPLLRALDRAAGALSSPAPQPEPVPPAGLDLSPLAGGFPLWIEVSPRAEGFPAVGERLAELPADPWALPPEIVGRLPEARLHIRAVDEAGRERLHRRLELSVLDAEPAAPAG